MKSAGTCLFRVLTCSRLLEIFSEEEEIEWSTDRRQRASIIKKAAYLANMYESDNIIPDEVER